MGRGREEGRPVLVKVPKKMYEQIQELVKKGHYRAPADFFYVAGQKELEKAIERLKQWEKMQEEGDCEILSDAEVV